MSDVNDPMSWVEYADNDLAIARAALRRREPFAHSTKVDIRVAVDVKLLNTLSDHAVRSRYPGDAPTLEDAREALEIAKAVRRFTRQYFGLK